MKHKITVVALAVAVSIGPLITFDSPTKALADGVCDSAIQVSALDLSNFPSNCRVEDSEIVLPNNLRIAVPEPGESYSMFVLKTNGDGDDATVYRNPDGTLGVEFNDVEYGDVPDANDALGVTAAIMPLAANASTCNYGTYVLLGGRWTTTHNWRYNPKNEANSSSLTVIKGGLNTWRTGTNQCTGTTYSSSFPSGYLSTTTLVPSATYTGCTVLDGNNVVGWRSLGSGILATTCSYGSPSISEADITFSTASTWFSSTSTTGCSGQYDLASIATHEFGHLIGLGHEPSLSGQTMIPSFGTCQLAYRKLGLGDLNGLFELYQ